MFNLSFLNSAILSGLVAALIPVIIHFFVKYRPKMVKFSSLKFIKKIHQNKARYIKIRQLLLLIIRILIILLVILALARPVIKDLFTSENWQNHAPTTTAIIIDNSFSMNYLIKNKTGLVCAKDRAKAILDMLSEKDRIMLLTLTPKFNNKHKYFTDKAEIRQELEGISITDNPARLQDIIITADEELQKIDEINKEIYLLSDNQAYNWQSLNFDKFELTSDLFVMNPLNSGEETSNLATLSAAHIPALLTSNGKPKVKAVIKNFSNQKQEDILVSLNVNNLTKAEKAISLNGNQKKSVVFDLNIHSTKNSFGDVSIKDQVLPDDNKWYFNYDPNKKPKILLTTNKPVKREFAAALDLITNGDWNLVAPQALALQDIEQHQLLILYKLEEISAKLKHFLAEILNKDKSVMLVPNAKAPGDNLSKWLQQEEAQLQNLTREDSEVNYVNYLHPVTSILTKEMFSKARFNKMWKSKTKGFSPLIGTPSGALISIKDKLLLCSINFEPGWTNLASQPVFPVLIYNIANFLGRYDSDLQTYEVGSPFAIQDKGELKCKLPNGETLPLLVEHKNSENFTRTDWQGHYFIFSQDDRLRKIVSYNTSRAESNLSRLSQKEMEDIESHSSQIHFLNSKTWKKRILTSRYGYGLWKILLWTILALLIIEMLLAYSGKWSFKKSK